MAPSYRQWPQATASGPKLPPVAQATASGPKLPPVAQAAGVGFNLFSTQPVNNLGKINFLLQPNARGTTNSLISLSGHRRDLAFTDHQ
jgi:hypothetical protein